MRTKTIDISAGECFDKINGNGYFSALVTVNYGLNNEANLHIPFQCGYSDQFETEARNVLVKHGYLKNLKNHSYHSLSWLCRDNNIILRSRKLTNYNKSTVLNW